MVDLRRISGGSEHGSPPALRRCGGQDGLQEPSLVESKSQSSLKAQSQQVSTSYELLQHDLPLRLRQAWLPAVLMH